MTITVRDGRLDEREALEALQGRSSRVWADHRADLDAHPDAIVVEEAWFGSEAAQVRVAEVDGAVGGFSVVLPAEEAGVAELDGLFVEPELLGAWIGRLLVEDAADRARAAGKAAIAVIANENALGFYEKAGFTVVGGAQSRFGPAARMRRRL